MRAAKKNGARISTK